MYPSLSLSLSLFVPPSHSHSLPPFLTRFLSLSLLSLSLLSLSWSAQPRSWWGEILGQPLTVAFAQYHHTLFFPNPKPNSSPLGEFAGHTENVVI